MKPGVYSIFTTGKKSWAEETAGNIDPQTLYVHTCI